MRRSAAACGSARTGALPMVLSVGPRLGQVMVSPGKAGGFSCEPLKAALDVAATRPLGPPYGWLR